jgi:hypothetical protein
MDGTGKLHSKINKREIEHGLPEKNAKKIILIVVILLLSPYLIMGSALILALAYTRWSQVDFQWVGGIALMVLGLGAMIYRTLSMDRRLRGLYLVMTGPAIIGLGLSTMTSNIVYMLLGVAIT